MSGKTSTKQRQHQPLPSREEILEFLQSAPENAGKREIVRAFNISGGQRIALKRLLKDMADDGLISGPRKKIAVVGELPAVGVIEIVSRDDDGEFVARPERWDGDTPAPTILVLGTGKRGDVAGVGDRVLARLSVREPADGYAYEARPIKKLPRDKTPFLGIFHESDGNARIDPVEKKHLKQYVVEKADTGEAKSGELVRFEAKKTGRYGPPHARVIERLGNPAGQQSISLIAIHAHGIPDHFPDAVIAESERARPAGLEGREDLRDVPLVTIDPDDARDHDDAVFAEPDEDERNPGGWIVWVAIADVAHYVRPGSALDREALKRGNSVYFPDRVVPMLPERISNDLCSLREGEARACLAVRMIFDSGGNKRGHRFVRGLMRSAARLTYSQAQAAIDGAPDDKTGPLMERVLQPLWSAYHAVWQARETRAPLDLDLPERKLILDDEGRVTGVTVPPRLDAHKLVEEFMIQANVAAAEMLEKKKSPVVYRVHDAPSQEKVASLSEFLQTLGLSLPKAQVLKPEHFNRVLEAVDDQPAEPLVNEVVLRSQAQAEYNPHNAGHFGLNLRRYAHFTSPIRRYADLLVHRALIAALDFGPDGLTDAEIAELADISQAISDAERRAMAAERETVDRLTANYLADQVGATFTSRISGVTRSGLFVQLAETGADGFIPASTIGDEFFAHDEAAQSMVGRDSGTFYRLGDTVEVKLVEAVPTAGALRFKILSEGRAPEKRAQKRSTRAKPPRGKPKTQGSRRRAKRR